MKKGITILSALSMVISIMAVLLTVLFLTILWKPMCSIYVDSMQGGPIIPVGNVVYLIGCLIVTVLLLVTCWTNKYIIIEILPLVLLCVILPVIPEIFDIIQLPWINPMGSMAVASFVVTKRVLDFSLCLMNVSSIISVVTCGMRIAMKVNNKKQRLNG